MKCNTSNVLTLLTSIILLSGCGPKVVFETPIVSPENASPCEELLGVYPLGYEDGVEGYFLVSDAGEAFPENFLRISFLISPGKNGRVEFEGTSMVGFCWRDGEDFFFHLPLKKFPLGKEPEYFENRWLASETASYEIYQFSRVPAADGSQAKTFEWSFPNSMSIVEQIQEGHLEGKIVYEPGPDQEDEGGTIQSVHVTASSSDFQKFIKFTKKHKITGLFEPLDTLSQISISDVTKGE